jgi:hypothetical protein
LIEQDIETSVNVVEFPKDILVALFGPGFTSKFVNFPIINSFTPPLIISRLFISMLPFVICKFPVKGLLILILEQATRPLSFIFMLESKLTPDGCDDNIY